MAQSFDEKYPYIMQDIKELKDAQIAGLIALLVIAVDRERTSVFHQWQKLGFTDVPEKLVVQIDSEMGDVDRISLANSLTLKAYLNLSSKASLAKFIEIKPLKFEDIPMPEFKFPKDWESFFNSDPTNNET